VLVAVYDKQKDVYYKTDRYWSRTTSKHVKQFIAGHPLVLDRPQIDFERLHQEVLRELYDQDSIFNGLTERYSQ
jgi:hypothetical protein